MTASKQMVGSSDAVMETLRWMRKRGLVPVALRPAQKAAVSRNYVDPDYKPPDDLLWQNNNYGVGLVTGNYILDVDLDCPEAVFFADRFFPPTPAIFGRASKQRSHRLYRIEASPFQRVTFEDPVARASSIARAPDADRKFGITILELRGDGGHQTVMPGSIHEGTGEPIEWSDAVPMDVASAKVEDCHRAGRKTGLATLVVRYVWADGYHNEPCKHLAGLLFRLEWPLAEAEDFIQAVMDYSGDVDKSRIPTVRATYRRGATGKKISGHGVLRKQLKNDALVDKIVELAGSPVSSAITEYNERFAVVMIGDKFRIAITDVPPSQPPAFCQKEDWMNLMSVDYSDQRNDKGIPILKSKLWLANSRRRSYDRVDFVPGDDDATGVLNLWTGWAVEPRKGRCDAWLELLSEVICGGDGELYRWMLHWLANIVREPRDKSMTAPVIIGVEGAGKSLMLGYFGKILGSAYVVITNEEHVYGRFNAHLGHALLLHSEEALYGGEKKHAGIIRSLITDDTRIFERKGIDAQQVRNYLRLVLTSNDSHAAPAKAGDRRYTVIDMGARKADDELIARVLKEIDQDGPAALHHFLITMDYDPQLPRVNVKNQSLLSLKRTNMTPVEGWWHDTLMAGQVLPDYLRWCQQPPDEPWPDTVSSVALYRSMIIYTGINKRSYNDTKFGVWMAKALGKTPRKMQYRYDDPNAGATSADMPSIPLEARNIGERQSSIVDMPSLDVCRAAFERYWGQTIEWEEVKEQGPRPAPQDHERF